MKNLFFTLILLVISAFTGFGQSNQTPKITYNDSSYIKIVANNIIDTLSVQVSFFPNPHFFGGEFRNLDIVKPGVYYMALGMTIPGLVYFNVGEDFQSFIIPGDTLELNVGFKVDDKLGHLIYYKINRSINDYYQAKNKKFGYYSFIDPKNIGIDRFYKEDLSRSEYNEAIDIINYSTEQNNLFLEQNKKNLPLWFLDLEKADIHYGAAKISLGLFNKLKSIDQKRNPFINIDLNNPKALLSSIYYSFLFDYFFSRFLVEQNVLKDINNWKINLFTFQSNLADSLLSGEIKDYFITCQLANLYSGVKKAADVKKVDSLILADYPKLSEDKIQYINLEKKRYTRFIKNELSKGDDAPGFYLKDLNGVQYQLSNFAGKVVYFHFWTTLSKTSDQEFRTLNELYSKIEGKPIEIAHVCMDDNPDKWKQIIEKENLKGINLICKGKWDKALKNSYFIEEMPHYTLVDKNGIVILNKCKGPDEIFSELLELAKDK